MAAHFGAMLMNRRRQLGLSIQQVANVVKIRPQIIEFFENEDFSSMPPRGYAQGMISSYARYLGLNPTQVVNAYLSDLHDFENAAPGLEAGRFQDAAAEASPRSSNAQGRYYMVDSAPASRYGSRPPQAGYVSESTSLHQPVSASRLKSASIVNARDPQAQGRPAESGAGAGAVGSDNRGRAGGARQGGARGQRSGQGARSQADGRQPRAQGQRQGNAGRQQGSGQRGGTGRSRDAYQQGGGIGQGYGSRGNAGRQQNGYGQRGYSQRGYDQRGGQGAYSRQQRGGRGNQGAYGGRGAYGNQGSGSRGGRGQQGRRRSGGLLSGISPAFLVGGTAIIVLLLVFLVMGISKGCTSSEAESAGSAAASTSTTIITDSASTTADEETSAEDDSTDDEAEAAADSDDGTADTEEDADSDSDSDAEEADDSDDSEDSTAEEAATSEETVVTVEIADGAVAYLEVKLDGVSVLGSDQVGPVTLDYTVEEQIVITTDSPSDVKVYLNGEKVSYDVKTSGVAKVTLSASSSSDDASDEDSTDE